ncbi:MAG: NUDIX hydrolase [Candidatus Altiarchaeota archaeon]|nr:NUDIX hydrolase [Candidatus Altiarchaeota archaeon]
MEHRGPSLAVDAVVVDGGGIILVKRKNPPFKGWWALPGGFVGYGETVEYAVRREVLEETGLEVRVERLIGVYSDPKRDPRGHTISVVFLCKKEGGSLRAESDAVDVGSFPLSELPELAFDHNKVVRDSGLL